MSSVNTLQTLIYRWNIVPGFWLWAIFIGKFSLNTNAPMKRRASMIRKLPVSSANCSQRLNCRWNREILASATSQFHRQNLFKHQFSVDSSLGKTRRATVVIGNLTSSTSLPMTFLIVNHAIWLDYICKDKNAMRIRDVLELVGSPAALHYSG